MISKRTAQFQGPGHSRLPRIGAMCLITKLAHDGEQTWMRFLSTYADRLCTKINETIDPTRKRNQGTEYAENMSTKDPGGGNGRGFVRFSEKADSPATSTSIVVSKWASSMGPAGQVDTLEPTLSHLGQLHECHDCHYCFLRFSIFLSLSSFHQELLTYIFFYSSSSFQVPRGLFQTLYREVLESLASSAMKACVIIAYYAPTVLKITVTACSCSPFASFEN